MQNDIWLDSLNISYINAQSIQMIQTDDVKETDFNINATLYQDL